MVTCHRIPNPCLSCRGLGLAYECSIEAATCAARSLSARFRRPLLRPPERAPTCTRLGSSAPMNGVERVQPHRVPKRVSPASRAAREHPAAPAPTITTSAARITSPNCRAAGFPLRRRLVATSSDTSGRRIAMSRTIRLATTDQASIPPASKKKRWSRVGPIG